MKRQEKIRRALLKWMDDCGVSQRDIAKLSGCSQTTISNILNNKVVKAYSETLERLDEATKPWQCSGATDPSSIENTPKLRDFLVDVIIDNGLNWEQVTAAMHVADVPTAQGLIQDGKGDFYPGQLAGLLEIAHAPIQRLPIEPHEKELMLAANVPRIVSGRVERIDVIPVTATFDVELWKVMDTNGHYHATETIAQPDDGEEWRAFKLAADRGERFRAGDVVMVHAKPTPPTGKRSIVILKDGSIYCAKAFESGSQVILADIIGGADFRTVDRSDVAFVSQVRRLVRSTFDE